MSRTCATRLLSCCCLVTLAVVVLAGCAGGSTVKRPEAPSRLLADGEQIGAGVGASGATTATAGVRTLLAMACNDGQLIVRTNREGIVAQMDCTKAVPRSTLDRFLGQPVTITYKDAHLRIDNPQAGTIDAAAAGATLTGINATP